MKTVKKILAVTFLGLGISVVGQTAPPAPPATPSTIYTNGTTTVSTNSSNVSVITQSGDYGKGGNTSFSVSNSNDEYNVKARYPKNRYPALKEFLIKEMGVKAMQSSGTALAWSLEGDEDTVYEIELDESKLKIKLDKEIASLDMIATFEDMGNVMRTLVSGGNEHQEIKRLERDADRARRDAERMQREADRLRAMSERDAARLSREAALLDREAERLSLVSKRGGGIDGYVREVLNEKSTFYDSNTTGVNGWKWPAMQSALLSQLTKDGLIKNTEDVVFIKEDSGIYINGEKLNASAWSKYNNLFRTYDYIDTGDLSFYKKGSHIAIVNSATNLDDLIAELILADLLRDNGRETNVEINGASVMVDGRNLPAAETKIWNTYLHKYGIIPAPGKKMVLSKNFASLGYSFGKNTLGTWISRG